MYEEYRCTLLKRSRGVRVVNLDGQMFCGPYSDTPAAAEGAGGERLKAVVSHWYCGERGKSVLSDFC